MGARDIDFQIVQFEELKDKDFMLTEGDIVFVENWEELSFVAANLHDDRRDELDNSDRDKFLNISPIECRHDFDKDPEEELEGIYLLIRSFHKSNKNTYEAVHRVANKFRNNRLEDFPITEEEDEEVEEDSDE